MAEWYAHALRASTLYRVSPPKTINVVEFFYPQEINVFERELAHARQAAHLQTGKEDDEIAQRMDAGRLALMHCGDDAPGPYQTPMQEGTRHLHGRYRTRLERAGGTAHE